MLKNDLHDGMITSMKQKDKTQTAIFRMINAEIKNEEIAQKCEDLPDAEVIKVLKKLQKQMKESREAFEKAGNQERANEIKVYILVIDAYLPRQLGENDIRCIIYDVLDGTKNTGISMGEAMKLVMAKVKGQADGKLVQRLVIEYMGNKNENK